MKSKKWVFRNKSKTKDDIELGFAIEDVCGSLFRNAKVPTRDAILQRFQISTMLYTLYLSLYIWQYWKNKVSSKSTVLRKNHFASV